MHRRPKAAGGYRRGGGPRLAGQPLFDEPAHLAQIGPTLQPWFQDPHHPADVAQGLRRDLLDGLPHESCDPRRIERRGR
jgi:hypothetical protein